MSRTFPPRIADLIMLRDQHRCVMCGGKKGLTIHARTRDPKYGNAAAGIAICRGMGTSDCRGWIETDENAARESGYLVDNGTDPTTVPIMHQLHGQVVLSDRGTCIRYSGGRK